MKYYCWQCYGRNDKDSGACENCAGEISPPANTNRSQRLVWASRHPDPDVAILATRRLSRDGDTDSVAALRALIIDPPDPFVAAEALRSLLARSTVDTERELLRHLADTGPVLLRAAAREALDEPPTEVT